MSSTLSTPSPVSSRKYEDLHDYQQAAIDKLYDNNEAYAILPMGCHERGTRIVMGCGFRKPVESVKPGDRIMGPNGANTVVQLCRGREQMYRITPKRGGAPFTVNENHVLVLVSTNEGSSYPSRTTGNEIRYITVKEYLSKSQTWKNLHKLLRNHISCIFERESSPLPIPPYILGALLGDGTLRGVAGLTTTKDVLAKTVSEWAQHIGCKTRVTDSNNTRTPTYFFPRKNTDQQVNPLNEKLRELDLFNRRAGDKFIPGIYLLSDVATRLELLAGLLDTDGHTCKSGYQYSSKSEELVDGIQFLARSLGFSCSPIRVKTVKEVPYYVTYITGDTVRIPARIKPSAQRKQKKRWFVSGFDIVPAGIGSFYGFTLAKGHTYFTEDFTVHHNSGKTIIGMTALQELMADGHIHRPLVLAPLRVAEITWPDEHDLWEHTRKMPLFTMTGGGDGWHDAPLGDARFIYGIRLAAERRLDWLKRKELAETDTYKLRSIKNEKTELAQILISHKEEEFEFVRALRTHEPAPGCYVMNYENIEWLTTHFKPGKLPFDAILFDELDRLKNHRGTRFKEIRKHAKLMALRQGMSGTPAPEGMLDLFGQVMMLDGGRTWGKNHDKWKRRYFMPTDYMNYDWVLQPGAQKRMYQDIAHLTFRVPEEDLTYRPGMQFNPIYVKLDDSSMKKYRKMERELAVALKEKSDTAKAMFDIEGEDPDIVIASNAAVASGKMRQIIQGFLYREDGTAAELHLVKLKALIELIEARQGAPVLLAYEFQEDLRRFQKRWPGIPYLGSGVSSRKARQVITDWNAGKIRVLPIHPASAGHGLNLQHGGSHIIWYNVPWARAYFDQTNARIDRQGQTRKCFGHLIMAKGTIEETAVWPSLQDKGREQATFVQMVRSVLS